MKHLVFLTLILVFCCGGAHAQTFVNISGCNTGTVTCNITLALTTGNTVILLQGLSVSTTACSTPTDAHNTYTAVSGTPFDNVTRLCAWLTVATATATETIACTQANNTPNMACTAAQYSGLAATPTVDKTASAANVATTVYTTGTTAATTQAVELVVGLFSEGANDSGLTPGTGYTIRRSDTRTGITTILEDKNVIATGTQTASISNLINSTGGGFILTLKTPTSGIVGPKHKIVDH